MRLPEPLMRHVRQAVKSLRHNSARAGRVATRFNRAGHYAWDLIVWSRVAAARSGIVPLELPEGLLARKGASRPPLLRVRSPGGRCDHFNDGFAAVHTMLFANLQPPDLLSPHRYALPGPAFRGVYLWDSAFIAQIWRGWDRAIAVDILRSVVVLRDGDRLQHVVADFVQSSFTQPPLVAWSLAGLLADAPEGEAAALAEEFYPPLSAYHRWLRQNRRLENGLYAWLHPYESGVDNSPRFATRSESRFERTTGVAAPDFSTYAALDAEALADCARRLGRGDEADEFLAEAAEIRAAVDRHLWHEADGMYYDFDYTTGAWKRVRTIASLLPLWAGAGSPERVDRLAAAAMDPGAFGTRIPLPSVALDDPAFEADMWRGPVWVNTAYAVLLGLRRHGRIAEVAELAWRLCDGVYRVFQAERQIYEFYDPREARTTALRRKRGNWWKRLTLGGGPQREFVGWSGLVNRIVVEMLFGFAHEQGRRIARPAFPGAASGAAFRLTLAAEGLTLEIAVESPDRMQGFVQDAERLRTFTAGFGETIDLDALLHDERVPDPAAAR